MDKNTELRELIMKLVEKMDDEMKLRQLYRYVNELYCKQ